MKRRIADVPSRVPSLSDQLAALVVRSGRLPAAIAAAAGVAPSVLSRFLSGKRSLNLDTVDRLAEALGGLRLTELATPRRRGQPRPATAEVTGDDPPDVSPVPDGAGEDSRPFHSDGDVIL